MTEQGALKVSFPWGMPGLDYNEFTLSVLAPDSPFFFLRSTEEIRVGLLLINPFVTYNDYQFELEEEVAQQLKISNEKQVVVLCAVNTSRGIKSATVNLLAPIVINTEEFLAKQIVLNDKRYSLRTPLVFKKEMEKGDR